MSRAMSVSLFACVILLLHPNSVHAQDASKPNADGKTTPADVFGGFFGDSMQAQLTEMTNKVIDGYLDYLAQPQTAKKLATFQKNYYDALVEQGFTEDQAFELLLRFGNPLAEGPRSGK